jgi:hypothetical protein
VKGSDVLNDESLTFNGSEVNVEGFKLKDVAVRVVFVNVIARIILLVMQDENLCHLFNLLIFYCQRDYTD